MTAMSDAAVEAGLDRAMRLVWSKGYEATTTAELAEAIDEAAPGLAGDYVDRDALLLSLLGHYGRKYGAPALAILEQEQDPRRAVERMFDAIVDRLSNRTLPRSCLLTITAISHRSGDGRVEQFIAETMARTEYAIWRLLQRSQSEGLLPGRDIRALARFWSATAKGMAVMSMVTDDRAVLEDIAREALLSWDRAPTTNPQAWARA